MRLHRAAMISPAPRAGRTRRHGRLLALGALVTLAGCSRPFGVNDVLTEHERWAVAFTTAQQAAAAGDYVRADTTLLAFARMHPGTPEARDAVFWRGVLALDPANPRASATAATAAFDEYLRGGAALLRRQEAEVMRRVAQRLKGDAPVRELRVTAVSTDSLAADPRDEEIRKLREQLKTTTEELERVRRRIATPTPPPDPPAGTRTSPPPATSLRPDSPDAEQRQ